VASRRALQDRSPRSLAEEYARAIRRVPIWPNPSLQCDFASWAAARSADAIRSRRYSKVEADATRRRFLEGIRIVRVATMPAVRNIGSPIERERPVSSKR
jgi:hypothetical protein